MLICLQIFLIIFSRISIFSRIHVAPDKDWKQNGIYPPFFCLIGYFNLVYQIFVLGIHLKANKLAMKQGLGSTYFLFTFSFTFRNPTDTILLSISETAISVLCRKSNVFIKSSMILRTFNAVFKLSFETILLFYCSGAFSSTFCHCYRKVRQMP